jgi:hypothetical protein
MKYFRILKCTTLATSGWKTCFSRNVDAACRTHLCGRQTYLKPIFHKGLMQWEGCGLWHLVGWCNLILNVPPWTRRSCDRIIDSITHVCVCVCVALSTCKLHIDIESGLWERQFVSCVLLLIGPSCFLSDTLWVHNFKFCFFISHPLPPLLPQPKNKNRVCYIVRMVWGCRLL